MRFAINLQPSRITPPSRSHSVICAEIRDRRHHISGRKNKRTASERAIVTEMLTKLKAGEDVRSGTISEIRASLAAETFDETARLDTVVDRLLNELQD